jgi:methylenetetrahydrofolate dehydrogenase (NADP+)/methenyltetrahydrofolate cyclohydrolase
MFKSLTGKEPAAQVIENAKKEVAKMKRKPHLVIVLVGNDPASEIYVRKKLEKAESIGVRATLKKFDEKTSEKEVLALVCRLNEDDDVDGFIVQAPLPKQIDQNRVLDAIDPKKDVDGWTVANLGKLTAGMSDAYLPATPAGVMKMLEFYKVPLRGKHAVVVGRSNVVGKPMALLLLAKDATVTICHSKTQNLANHTRNADVIVAAAGNPKLITADMVKEGAFIIDVGTTKVGDKTVGDVDYENVIKKANCSPVPGGVGPMTVAMLISNVLDVAKRQRR